MSRAVGVGVVPGLGAVLDVRHVDGDAPVPLLRRVVDHGVVPELGQLALGLGGEHLGDGGRQGGLPVVHVPDSADVAVGLVPLENLLLEGDGGGGEAPGGGGGAPGGEGAAHAGARAQAAAQVRQAEGEQAHPGGDRSLKRRVS